MRRAWRGVGLLAAGIRTAATAACGADPRARSSSQLILYNGQHEQTTQALVDAFEKQTGISVTIRSGDEDTLAEQIMQEGSRSPPTCSTRRTRRRS